ncbi:MAG: histidine kinase [Spirosoma sp.]|nr:histidine kinase [Spirosoma sp.]
MKTLCLYSSIMSLLWLADATQAGAQSPGELLNIQDYRAGNTMAEASGSSLVQDIMQDRRGFMWFATTKGLIRHDGVNYRHYYHHPGQPYSLAGNSVKEIRETPAGDFYLALNDAGLSYFRPNAPESEAFTNYTHDPKNSRSIPTNVLYALDIDRAGIVWMGGQNSGLIRFDPHTQQFSIFRWPMAYNEDLETSVHDLLADPDGSIWIGTSSAGLLHFQPKTGTFDAIALRPLIPVSYAGSNSTGSMCIDKTGQTLWFASIPLGPCQLDRRTGKVSPITNPASGQTQTLFKCPMSTKQDKAGTVWITDQRYGLYSYNTQTQLLTHISLIGTNDPTYFETAYLDPTQTLWLASGKGVVRYKQAAMQVIQSYPIQNRAGRTVPGVRQAEQDGHGNYWLELPDALARYDTVQRAIVETIPYPSALKQADLNRMQVLGQQVFVHSSTGLFILNQASRHIESLSRRSTGNALGSTIDLFPDTIAGKPLLWIGTFRRGLMRYWPQDDKLESVPLGNGAGQVQEVKTICQDRQKIIWIATDGQGLVRLDDKQTGRSTQFLARPNDPAALPDNELMDVLEDHSGQVWVATLTHGLVRVNQQQGRVSFTTFADFPDGPPSRIFSFFEDARHLFWVTTGDGLYLFNPASGRFLKHQATDQLLFPHDHEEMSHSPDGYPLTVVNNTILKGSDAGNLFDAPDNPLLHLTDFRIFNQSHPELLTNSIAVQLLPDQNGFSIAFAAPWFQHPEQIRYRYRLVGFDRGWTEADRQREAFYTNIPHGNYTFQVQASWDGTARFTQTRSLPITVLPEFWETTGFRLLVGLLLGLLGWAVWSYRQRETYLKTNLKLAQAEKQQRETELREQDAIFQRRLAETEMTALRSQMNPHFIFNCLNSVKLYTLQNDTDRAADYLTKFARLIRLVLENSKAERVTLQNELEALQLYIELEAMRFKQKVQFLIEVSPAVDVQFTTIPPLLIQPYVENAIWHGLMHKPDGGTITILVNQPSDDCLTVVITDDGVGRARAAQLKSKSANQAKSFGMKMTSDRISLINHHYDTQTAVRVRDLVDAGGRPSGTEVVLHIPV